MLNAIVHPPTIEAIFTQSDEHFRAGVRIVAIESALIYTAKLEEKFDYILAVLSPPELIIERLRQQRGLTEAEIQERLDTQASVADRCKGADFILRNAGTVDELKQSCHLIFRIIESYLK